MSHPLPPPKGGGKGVGAALTHPTAASPLLKRGVDDGDGDDGLTQARLISSRIMSSNTTKAISEAAPKPRSCQPGAKLPV